jgi:hypothetical protein
MKILVVSDIHADIERILPLLDKIKEMDIKFDVVVCPGDVIDINIPPGFKSEDITKIVIEEFRTLGKPLLMVPGNMDGEIINFLKKEGVSIHQDGLVIENYGFYGFGGARTPFGTPFEPSEDTIRLGLEIGFSKVKAVDYKIQVTHVPPYNTKLDVISSGAHVGSESVRKFIEEKKPVLSISAHIHEARGIDKLNETFLINSGKFTEGYCGIVEIEKDKVSGKIISLI